MQIINARSTTPKPSARTSRESLHRFVAIARSRVTFLVVVSTPSEPLLEVPPTLESIDAKLNLLIAKLKLQKDDGEKLYDDVKVFKDAQLIERLEKLEGTASTLAKTATDLSNAALKLSALQLNAAIGPTPIKFGLLIASSFFGGFLAQVLAIATHLRWLH